MKNLTKNNREVTVTTKTKVNKKPTVRKFVANEESVNTNDGKYFKRGPMKTST